MFDQARNRPDLADRFSVSIVALMFLIMLAAIPLVALDFDQATAPASARVDAPTVVKLATDERSSSPCRTVVLCTPERPAEVPSTRPL